MFDIPTFGNGLALGFGIFICPGPKDVLILRQTLLGRPAFELIAIGCISDSLLIWLGITGLSAAFVASPVLQSAALWFAAQSAILLNPVAWLDAVLIVGSLGAALPQNMLASFGLGAVAASLGWFTVIVVGAQGAARWMASPCAWLACWHKYRSQPKSGWGRYSQMLQNDGTTRCSD